MQGVTQKVKLSVQLEESVELATTVWVTSSHTPPLSMGPVSINFKFLVKKSDTKTFQIFTDAYGEETLSGAHVFELCKRFSGGWVSVEDGELAGRPRSANADQNIRDRSGFPLTSVVRLLINTTTLKH
ncbi:hypothetical protein TNCV_2139581 [Trichonephila clavipes]|uniref:Uncharacterized protein n=1 Tax=Trichonephila clavipes TaxID=2585209 RepID=A0A8X6S1Z2_TRICX|nr:hypothetical protein TNCV_2139581 [Trichonephila clavipes]